MNQTIIHYIGGDVGDVMLPESGGVQPDQGVIDEMLTGR